MVWPHKKVQAGNIEQPLEISHFSYFKREAGHRGELSTWGINSWKMINEREVTGTHFKGIWNLAGGWLGRCMIFTFIQRGLKFKRKEKYKDRQWNRERDGREGKMGEKRKRLIERLTERKSDEQEGREGGREGKGKQISSLKNKQTSLTPSQQPCKLHTIGRWWSVGQLLLKHIAIQGSGYLQHVQESQQVFWGAMVGTFVLSCMNTLVFGRG